jgi:hypothetical protein
MRLSGDEKECSGCKTWKLYTGGAYTLDVRRGISIVERAEREGLLGD